MSSSTRVTRRKLTAFALIATVALVVLAASYLNVPQHFGWGQMTVSATLPAAGGLGPNSRVTYRGQEVGRVTAVRIGTGPRRGVTTTLRLDRSVELPADVRASVHSMSVIGEQYLELAPPGRPSAAVLADGAEVPPAADPVPVDAGTLLTNVTRLLGSVDPEDLGTTVDELDAAFSGTGDALGSLLDSGGELIGTAQENLAATQQLIRNLEPVLRTQTEVAPSIRSLAANLALVTGQLRISDADLRQLIAQGPAALEQVTALATDLHPTLPTLLANLSATGQVLRVYLAAIKQVLVIYPAVAANAQVAQDLSVIKGIPDFVLHLNLNDPAPCSTGYVTKRRPVSDTTPRTTLPDQWCKVSPSSPTAVRGVRNSPCPNSSARSATAGGCGLDFTAEPKVTVTSYDPRTGKFRGPDGRIYRIDLSAPRSPSRSAYGTGLLAALTSG